MVRLERFENHNGAASVENWIAVAVQSAGMEQRQHIEVDSIYAHARWDSQIHGVPEVHAVCDHRPLGQTGCS